MPVSIKSFAEFKRTLKVGLRIKRVKHDWYPHMPAWEGTIAVVQSNAMATNWDNSPSPRPSWLFFDNGAKGFVFDGTNIVKYVLDIDKPAEERSFITYEILG